MKSYKSSPGCASCNSHMKSGDLHASNKSGKPFPMASKQTMSVKSSNRMNGKGMSFTTAMSVDNRNGKPS